MLLVNYKMCTFCLMKIKNIKLKIDNPGRTNEPPFFSCVRGVHTLYIITIYLYNNMLSYCTSRLLVARYRYVIRRGRMRRNKVGVTDGNVCERSLVGDVETRSPLRERTSLSSVRSPQSAYHPRSGRRVQCDLCQLSVAQYPCDKKNRNFS